MEQIVTIFVLHGFILGGFCAFVAGEKHRDQFAWAILGFFFGIVALLAIVGVPSLQAQPETEAESPAPIQKAAPLGYITEDGKRWVCGCGASNNYSPDKPIQNCINCNTNRDFALSNRVVYPDLLT
jgi:hypothetical protein